MVPYIPLELVHLIASAALVLGARPAEEDRRARLDLAKSLSLVCRAWCHVGQAALFRKVFLYLGQPNHAFLRTRQHHLLSHVHELDVEADMSSTMLDNKVVHCRRHCSRLSHVVLNGQGAWSAWFTRSRRLGPAASTAHVELNLASNSVPWTAALSEVLSSSPQCPSVTSFSVGLTSTASCAPLADLEGATSWSDVRSLTVIIDLGIGIQQSLVRALSQVFPLDRLTKLTLNTHRDPADLLPILRQTTSLDLLVLGVAARHLLRCMRKAAPLLAAMTKLKVLSLDQNMGRARIGGHMSFPFSLLTMLPSSLCVIDIDLAIAVEDRSAMQAYLAQRLDAPYASWTATMVVGDVHEAEMWIMCVQNGTRVWVRQ